MWLEQPLDPRPTDSALRASRAPAPALPELHALLRVVRSLAVTALPPCSSAGRRGPWFLSSPGLSRTLSTALLGLPTLLGVRGERGSPKRRGDGSCGGPSLEKVVCPIPGGGGVGGRGKTMPGLRRGRRRQQPRRARRLGAGRLPEGAQGSEAPAFTSWNSDAAGDRAGFQQPPSPPGGPCKSLDLGEGAVLSGITSKAGRRPGKP